VRRTEAEMRSEDADPSGQKAVDALKEAERHALGAASLVDDVRRRMPPDADYRQLEVAHRAIRECERQVLLARGFLMHPDGALNNVACPECVDRRRARLSA
jgi:hypothetical protein